jgi:APA family basic amino acid/polyamine antiporter
VLFAGYLEPLTGLHLAPAIVATATIAVLTVVTCLGVRASGNVQNALTVAKVGAILGVIVAGIAYHPIVRTQAAQSPGAPMATMFDLGVAMIPVLFAYNGATVASFMAPEAKAAARALPLGLWVGMSAVAVLYLLVNVACIQALGLAALAASPAPIADVLLVVTGPLGSRLVALVIVLATLGFISNRLLTVPRLYYAMARDGLFFRQVARIDPKTCVPVLAIVLQGAVAIVIALSGSYDRILNYVVSTAYLFAGMLALAVFVLRARDARSESAPVGGFRVPGHPVSTILVMAASWGIALDTCLRYPLDGLAGFAILASAFPVYFAWTRLRGAGPHGEKPGVC